MDRINSNAVYEIAKANERLAKRIEELEKELERYRWIPVEERLPEEGAEVIVTVDGGDKIDTFVSSDVCVAEGWQNWNGVIAWMPLPESFVPQN